MILSVLAAVPLVGAIALALMPKASWGSQFKAKLFAFCVSLITLAVSLIALARYDLDAGGYQLTEKHEWIKAFGAYYSVGINGISITLILLTTNAGSELIASMCKDPELLPNPEGLAKALREPLLKIFPPALLGRLVTIPYYPLSDEMLGRIVKLQLDRIKKRVESQG